MRTRKQTFIATLDPPPFPSRHSHPPCAPQPPPPYNAKMSTSSLSTQYTTRSNLGVPDNVLLRAKLSVVQQNRRQRRSRRSVAASSGLGGWRACRLDDTLVRRRQNPTRCQWTRPFPVSVSSSSTAITLVCSSRQKLCRWKRATIMSVRPANPTPRGFHRMPHVDTRIPNDCSIFTRS